MKTSSQTALKVLSIIGIVVGAIIAVSGIVLTVGANGFAMYQASSSGAGVAVLGTIGGVVLIVAGVFNVVVGVFGVRGAARGRFATKSTWIGWLCGVRLGPSARRVLQSNERSSTY